MRLPVRKYGPGGLRAARPTPRYNDELSDEFLDFQRAEIEKRLPKGFELTPVSGDAW